VIPKNREALKKRVVAAAEAALAAKGYASAIDVLIGIGWLDAERVERWRRRQIAYLERCVQSNLPRISEAMKMFRAWANARRLTASETQYVGRRPRREPLRFSKSGHPAIEALYRTHWVSPKWFARERERLAEKASPGAGGAGIDPGVDASAMQQER
jgi:hypothetical protein